VTAAGGERGRSNDDHGHSHRRDQGPGFDYVRVYTDEGIIGNGECIHGGEGCPAMVHALKRYLIGEDPLNVDRLFEKMRR